MGLYELIAISHTGGWWSTMLLYTSLTPADIDALIGTKFDIAVVVDVLRATTTLLFAARSGARRILPVAEIDDAFELAREISEEKILLCGERNGLRIKGFDIGNSPAEYSPDRVGGKTLIYASTNGSVLMSRVERIAGKTILASIRNISAAADFVGKLKPQRTLIACAGSEGRFSLEDVYCAGMLIDRLAHRLKITLADDTSLTARIIYGHFGDDVGEVFRASTHGRYLGDELGLWDDLAAASEIDADDIVLELINGVVTPVGRTRAT